MTPAGHLLSGYLAGDWAARTAATRRDRIRTLGAALFGSIAPDLDVVLGLIGGFEGARAHRGFTHSFLGAAILAALVALILRRDRRRIFAACFAGILTHIFWDAWNVWGVQALWPALKYWRGNLIHEGDFYAVGIVAIAAFLVWRDHRRTAAVWLALALPALFGFHFWWRAHAQELAQEELRGRRFDLYPTGKLRCGWIALSASLVEMRIDCVSSPLTRSLKPVRTVPIREDFFTRASEKSAAVREFLAKRPYSFAEQQSSGNGTVTVIWRDLREAFYQKPDEAPAGLYVRLDAMGKIVDERHRWWLSLW